MAKKTGFWSRDWFLGVLVTLVMLIASGSALLESLERKAYDLAMGMTQRPPSDRIAIIAIDKQSLDNIGRWPWSREIFANMIEKLSAAKAKVIATSVFFSEPQRDAGLGYIDRLIELNNARLTAESMRAAEQAAAEAAAPVGTTRISNRPRNGSCSFRSCVPSSHLEFHYTRRMQIKPPNHRFNYHYHR